jgi:hypothetical protein
LLLDMRRTQRIPLFESWAAYLTAWLDHRPADMPDLSLLGALKIHEDPEAMFQEGWLLCDIGEHDRGLGHLQRAVGKGYFVAPTLAGGRAFDALRNDPAFQALLARAEGSRAQALAAFREAGGERLLGQ